MKIRYLSYFLPLKIEWDFWIQYKTKFKVFFVYFLLWTNHFYSGTWCEIRCLHERVTEHQDEQNNFTDLFCDVTVYWPHPRVHSYITAARWQLQPPEVSEIYTSTKYAFCTVFEALLQQIGCLLTGFSWCFGVPLQLFQQIWFLSLQKVYIITQETKTQSILYDVNMFMWTIRPCFLF